MLITNASRLGDFFVVFFLRAEDCAEGGLSYSIYVQQAGTNSIKLMIAGLNDLLQIHRN